MPLRDLYNGKGDFMMRMNEIPAPSETPSVPPEVPPTPPPPKPKLFGKKLYLVIGLVAVVAVASAFTFIYLLPRGEAAIIHLGLNYSVGEKMTYEVAITMSGMGQSISQTGTISMEVLSFDGVNYTIRQKLVFQSQEFSYTVKMNKTGHIIDYSEFPPEFQQTFSSFIGMPGYGSYFQKEVVKVGESWQIPLNIQTEGFSLEGMVNYRLSEVRNITVPAGTYNAFRMDITANNIQGTYFGAADSGGAVNLVLNVNGYGYLEIGTSCSVEFNIQESVTSPYMGQTVSMNITMRVLLTEHTKQ